MGTPVDASVGCPSISSTVGSSDESFIAVLKTALSSITDILPVARSQVEIILSRSCCDALTPVKSIPGQFRAASQKHMPSKPSTFVPLILRPVKIFFGVDSKNPSTKALRDECCVSVSSNVVDEVASK